MNLDSIIFELSLIMVGAAVLGTLFLYAKQPIVIAYIVLGILLGPGGFGLIPETGHIENISHFGVILLLFLIGIHLKPNSLGPLFKKTSWLTLLSSLFFGTLSLLVGLSLGFTFKEALIMGGSMMFSSTVVGLKLIPTHALHHKRTGELMTSVLLLQDILAILVILFLTGDQNGNVATTFLQLIGKAILISALSFGGVKYVMIPVLKKFDVVQEFIFVATLGWCLLWAETAHLLGLSYEIGAFIAGLSIASCQIALVIAEHLKPLREFFLILFFFSVGAGINFDIELKLLIPAIVFGAVLVPIKAWVMGFGFRKVGESESISRELGVRMSQSSEFSLLVVYAALSAGMMTADKVMVIQVATIISFIVSTYWVVRRYATPISV